jgi:hypothetical protein
VRSCIKLWTNSPVLLVPHAEHFHLRAYRFSFELNFIIIIKGITLHLHILHKSLFYVLTVILHT